MFQGFILITDLYEYMPWFRGLCRTIASVAVFSQLFLSVSAGILGHYWKFIGRKDDRLENERRFVTVMRREYSCCDMGSR